MSTQESKVQRERWLLQEMDRMRATLQLVLNRRLHGPDGRHDVIDQVNHVVEVNTDRALQRLYQQKLRQLERAWARLCEGRHGICESCGTEIDPARLDVIPYATLCISCQRRSERMGIEL